jgi:hypothetical protein
MTLNDTSTTSSETPIPTPAPVVKREQPKVVFEKNTIERYEFKKIHGCDWAFFTIDERNSLFSCESSFGRFGYTGWTSRSGETLKEFIVRISTDPYYVMTKIQGGDDKVLDEKMTKRALRKDVRKKYSWVNKNEREFYEACMREINELDFDSGIDRYFDSVGRTEYLDYIYGWFEKEKDYETSTSRILAGEFGLRRDARSPEDRHGYRFISDPASIPCETKPKGKYIAFMEVLFPLLIKELKRELGIPLRKKKENSTQ